MMMFSLVGGGGDDGSSPTTSRTQPPPSSGHPPTAVQFYSDSSSCHVDFRSLTASGVAADGATAAASGTVSPVKRGKGGGDAHHRAILPHADLSYHSVNVPSENDDDVEDDRIMGVWNCRVSVGEDGGGGRSARLTGMLLDRVILAPDLPSSTSSDQEEKKEDVKGGSDDNPEGGRRGRRRRCAFVVTIDLGRPNEVVPTVRAAIGSIVRHLESEDDDEKGDDDDAGAGAAGDTTTLEALSGTTFGEVPPPAEEDGKGAGSGSSGGAGSSTRKKIALVLACLVPPAPPATYQEKQAQALVTYHLHRYACALDCTLAFVRRGGGPEEDAAAGASGATIDVPTLCRCVYRVAMGLPPTDDDADETAGTASSSGEEGTATAGDDDVTAAASSASAAGAGAGGMALVGPGRHDRTVIESTLRRNANCEGQWDVDKDALAVALPPPPPTRGASTAPPPTQQSPGEWDDEVWMGRLASTVKVGTVGAPATSSSAAAGGAAAGKKGAGAAAAGKKKKAAAPGAGNSASGASDAASFFENLLKK